MKLYCVRHGETTYNFAGRIQGQRDSELSELGRRQCQLVADALAKTQPDAVISSPLKRALETAECIGARLNVPVTIERRLIELNAGVFQGLDWAEIEQQFPADAAHWRSGDPDFRIPEGESRRDLMHRASDAFRSVREAGYRQAIIVAHGGSLSAALKTLLEIPAQRNPFSLGNGSISVVVWEKDFRLLSLNERGHLGCETSGGGDL